MEEAAAPILKVVHNYDEIYCNQERISFADAGDFSNVIFNIKKLRPLKNNTFCNNYLHIFNACISYIKPGANRCDNPQRYFMVNLFCHYTYFTDMPHQICTKNTEIEVADLVRSGPYQASVYACVIVLKKSSRLQPRMSQSSHQDGSITFTKETMMSSSWSRDLPLRENAWKRQICHDKCEVCSLTPAQVSCKISQRGAGNP